VDVATASDSATVTASGTATAPIIYTRMPTGPDARADGRDGVGIVFFTHSQSLRGNSVLYRDPPRFADTGYGIEYVPNLFLRFADTC